MSTVNIKCPKCGQTSQVAIPTGVEEMKYACPHCAKSLKLVFKNNQGQEPNDSGKTKLNLPKRKKEEQGGASEATRVPSSVIFNGREFPLNEGRNIVGRAASSSEADIQLPTNDMYLSRNHSQITVYLLNDGNVKATFSNYKNKNKSFVDGQQIEDDEEVILTDGVEIKMGNTIIRFKK